MIFQNNQKENARHVEYEYKPGDRVMILQDPSRKYGTDRYLGPFMVTSVNLNNGTAVLQQATPKGGVRYQTWNIWNLHPYKA